VLLDRPYDERRVLLEQLPMAPPDRLAVVPAYTFDAGTGSGQQQANIGSTSASKTTALLR
jgi:bifunctional non-homologous end joining protein LigD